MMRDPKERLLSVAARLVRGNLGGLSWFADDMPKSTPKSVLEVVERAFEEQQLMAREILDVLELMRQSDAASGGEK